MERMWVNISDLPSAKPGQEGEIHGIKSSPVSTLPKFVKM